MLFTGESIGLSVFLDLLRDKVHITNAFYINTLFWPPGVS